MQILPSLIRTISKDFGSCDLQNYGTDPMQIIQPFNKKFEEIEAAFTSPFKRRSLYFA